jgi:hypothetical protein
MRVKVTVYYGDGTPMVKQTKSYSLHSQEEDPESFDEANDYLTEQVLEPYASDGYDFEDDEEELAVGKDYVAAWVLLDVFDTRGEAKEFLSDLMPEIDGALADLE